MHERRSLITFLKVYQAALEKETIYECPHLGDHFHRISQDPNPSLTFRVSPLVILSNGEWEQDLDDTRAVREHTSLAVETRGGLRFTAGPLEEASGVLQGAGLALVSAYLTDSDGEKHQWQDVGRISLNHVRPVQEDVHAGDRCELKLRVEGGANMREYNSDWEQQLSDKEGIPALDLSPRMGFVRTGSYEWTAVNSCVYPAEAVGPFIGFERGMFFRPQIITRASEPVEDNPAWQYTRVKSARITGIRMLGSGSRPMTHRVGVSDGWNWGTSPRDTTRPERKQRTGMAAMTEARSSHREFTSAPSGRTITARRADW